MCPDPSNLSGVHTRTSDTLSYSAAQQKLRGGPGKSPLAWKYTGLSDMEWLAKNCCTVSTTCGIERVPRSQLGNHLKSMELVIAGVPRPQVRALQAVLWCCALGFGKPCSGSPAAEALQRKPCSGSPAVEARQHATAGC